jgi:hypothetical protein
MHVDRVIYTQLHDQQLCLVCQSSSSWCTGSALGRSLYRNVAFNAETPINYGSHT